MSLELKKRIGFLINPQNKSGKNSIYISWVLKSALLQKPLWEIQLFDKIWPFELTEFDEIWVMGGDGTFNFFVNSFPTCELPIGLFKGGTGNDFYWKIFGNISKEQHLAIILESNIRFIDAGQVNQLLFLNGVGLGIEGVVLKSMRAIRFLGGALGYYLAAIPAILKFKSYQITFEIAGRAISKNVFLCMIFNSSRAGGGFHFFPMASIDDGKLNMMLCDPIAIIKRLYYMPKIQKGEHLNFSFLEFLLVENVKIKCNRLLSAQVDGEILESDTFEFKILPAKFKFILSK